MFNKDVVEHVGLFKISLIFDLRLTLQRSVSFSTVHEIRKKKHSLWVVAWSHVHVMMISTCTVFYNGSELERTKGQAAVGDDDAFDLT